MALIYNSLETGL